MQNSIIKHKISKHLHCKSVAHYDYNECRLTREASVRSKRPVQTTVPHVFEGLRGDKHRYIAFFQANHQPDRNQM